MWVVNTRLKLQGAKFRNEELHQTHYKGIFGQNRSHTRLNFKPMFSKAHLIVSCIFLPNIKLDLIIFCDIHAALIFRSLGSMISAVWKTQQNCGIRSKNGFYSITWNVTEFAHFRWINQRNGCAINIMVMNTWPSSAELLSSSWQPFKIKVHLKLKKLWQKYISNVQ